MCVISDSRDINAVGSTGLFQVSCFGGSVAVFKVPAEQEDVGHSPCGNSCALVHNISQHCNTMQQETRHEGSKTENVTCLNEPQFSR